MCWQSLTKKFPQKSRSHRKNSWKVTWEHFLQYETWQASERFERKEKKMAWNILFSQWRQLHQSWKKRPCICWQSWWQTSVFIATSVFITISNVCIYCGICAILFIVDIINGTGKSRCHRYLLSEFQEITNIFWTIWYRQISQGILSQSKYSSRMMCMWNMWKLRLACKGIEY